jgi:hypothetical protein
MPITNYDYNLDKPYFEGLAYLSRNLRSWSNALPIIAKPSLVTPTPVDYLNYVSFGRIVVRVGGTTDCMYASHPAPGFLDIIGVIPATSARRRRFISPSGFNPQTNTYELVAGIAEDRVMPVVTEGHIWMYCEEPINPGDTVYFRYSNLSASNQAHGRLSRSDTPGETQLLPWCKIIRGTSHSEGGLVLVQFRVD